MPRLTRHLQNGAIFADSLSDLRALELEWGAVVTSLPTIVASPFGKAIQFDGSDDKIALGDISIRGTIKSVAIWVYLDSNTEQVIDLDGGTNYIHVSSGTVTATGFTSPTIYVDGAVSSAITAAGWHLIVVTTGTAVSPTSVQFATDNTNFGNVRLNDCSLWDRALSATEVDQLFKGTAYDYMLNLVSAWDLDDTALVQDIGWKGNGNDGTVGGNPTVVDGPSGGKALDSDGTGDQIDFGADSDFAPGAGSFSISGWWRFENSQTNAPNLFGMAAGVEGERYGLILGDNALQIRLFVDGLDGSFRAQTVVTGLNTGQWYHGVMVVDRENEELRYYQDGVKTGSTLDLTGLTTITPTGNAKIGTATTGSAANFDGDLAKIKYIGAALTNIQARDLYERERRGAA